ncbi:MAG: anthranilate synthase component I [Armatimonadota bacterium]
MLRPDRDDVARLARGGKRVPVYAELLADLETPTSAYWKLAHDRACSFLLESVTGGESLARWSFIGVPSDPQPGGAGLRARFLRTRGRSGLLDGEAVAVADEETPLDVLRPLVQDRGYAHVEGLPPFTGGAVGMLSYDIVRFFERLPDITVDDLECDDMAMLLCETIVAFDHARNRILVISHADDQPESYDHAAAEIGSIVERLRAPLPALPQHSGEAPSFTSNMSRDAYEEAVRRTIELIRAGDGVQMVISQRFSAPFHAHPLTLYRALRSLNPSPYMYLLRFGDYDVVGASPEILVTLKDRRVRVRPIAGTRPRGATEEEDERLEQELLADEKERAEHIMLVDLGRNDVGRIAEPSSVCVNDFMIVERYSHVMHIVSDVTGVAREGMDAFDVLRACFPAGTVSGAPKVRAMEIIEELEPTRRGCYAGAVGYFGFNGDMDMAIAIRTVFLKDGVAHVQAGAGIVFDSVPEREWEECHNKARAVMRAIEMAEAGLDPVAGLSSG